MRKWFIRTHVLFLVALLGAALPARGQDKPATDPPPLIRSFFTLPVQLEGATVQIEAMEIRPRGEGPFPLAVLAHGKPSGEDKRRALHADFFTPQAVLFARRGFATIVGMRRGYGSSQGNYVESDGTCEATRFLAASRAGARDLVAIAEAAAKRPRIDPGRAVLVGESVGGITALAVGATPPPGLRGIINFAGGRGARPESRGPEGQSDVCQTDQLVDAVRALAGGNKVPTLWVYGENDRTFGPALARTLFDAFVAGGGTARLVVTPPIPRDGHYVFPAGEPHWRSPVDDFLRRLNLPTGTPPQAPAVPRAVGDKGRAAFRAFAGSALPFKAFATSGTGAFGWQGSIRSIDEARRGALAGCQRHVPVCEVVAESREIEDR